MGILDGLLGTSMDDPRTMGLLALSAGLIKGDMGGGLLGFGQAYQGAQDANLKRQYTKAQMANLQSEADARQSALKAAQEKANAQIFTGGGMTGGAAQPQTLGGIQMFSQPMGVSPMQQQPIGIDVQAALRAHYKPEEIAALRALVTPKVARTVEVDDGNGGKMTLQLDEFGNPVGKGLPGYIAPVSVNQGDRQTFVRPAPGVSLPMFQSPDSRASVAATLRGQNMVDARAREQIQLGKVPAGYRQNPDGTLSFIPGGPADPNAAKRAAPTEFQGKAGMFGARAEAADQTIRYLQGQYSPMAINTKQGIANTPLIGGALEPFANWTMSDNAQRVEQAQRDFVNAVLRLESGAAISQSEFDNARKQYFPQPGDSQAVIEQKARNRQTAIKGLMANARPGTFNEPPNTGGASGSWSIQKVN